MSQLATQASVAPTAVGAAVALVLAVGSRSRTLARFDAALRVFVNGLLGQRDPYSMLWLVAALVGLARVVRRLRAMSLTGGIVRGMTTLLVPLLKRLPQVKAELHKAQAKVRTDLAPSLLKDLTESRRKLPTEGMPDAELSALLEKRRDLDIKGWADGTVPGALYHGERAHMDMIGKVYGMFAFFNPLHASLHPATRQVPSGCTPAMHLQNVRPSHRPSRPLNTHTLSRRYLGDISA